MEVDSALGDIQDLPHFARGLPIGGPAQYLDFARSQDGGSVAAVMVVTLVGLLMLARVDRKNIVLPSWRRKHP